MLINYEITPAGERRTTIDSVRSGFEEFYKENGRYPSSSEVNDYKYLPSVRLIERRFGGIVNVRKTLKLEHVDFRLSGMRHDVAIKINERGHHEEHKMHRYLVEKFGKVNVHREYMLGENSRHRIDFFVFPNKFCVEVFYPSTERNFTGCLNAKLLKLKKMVVTEPAPIYFVQMNDDLSDEAITKIVNNKKNKMGDGMMVMGFEKFKKIMEEEMR